MKRLTIMFALITVLLAGLFSLNQALTLAKSTSTTAGDTMTGAAQLYNAGRFAQAAQIYQQLVDQGYADSALYFNLGNAYAQQGDLGRAILNYRRAQALDPRDADITANLQLARNRAAQLAANTNAPGGNPAKIGRLWFTTNELAVLALLAWVVFVLLLIALTGSLKTGALQRGLRVALAGATLALVVSGAALANRLVLHNDQSAAVVVAGKVNAVTSPAAPADTAFSLVGGAEVELQETRGSWSRIALPAANLQGWVPANAVERVL